LQNTENKEKKYRTKAYQIKIFYRLILDKLLKNKGKKPIYTGE
jgi:hypothetical protein